MKAQHIVRRALVVAACALAQQVGAQTTWPTQQWPTATPQDVGIAKTVLDSIDSEITSGKYGYVDRMLVIRHGRVAFDRKYPQDYVRAYGDSVNKKNALNADDPTGPYDYFNDWWICTRCSR